MATSLKATPSDITARCRQGRFPNRQAISQGMVLRVLGALGVDTWNTTVTWPEYRTGEGRTDRVKKQETAFFNYFAPRTREILNLLLEKYATGGELQFTLPDMLKVPAMFHHGNLNEIIGKRLHVEKFWPSQ